MEILLLGAIKKCLAKHLVDSASELGYTIDVVTKRPKTPKYPLVILTEVRNQPIPSGHDRRQAVASVAYQVSAFMNDAIGVNNQELTRKIIHSCNDFLTQRVGLKQASMNEFDGEPYETRAMYYAVYYENKQVLY